MPQFDLANFLPQLVWLAIFFAILYFGIVRTTVPKVGRVMDAREQQVTGDIDTAERAKAEADRIQADYDAGIATAHDNARTRLASARDAAAKSLEAKLAESTAALNAKADAAEASLAQARGSALREIEGVAADIAADLVERLTGTRPAEDEAAAAARSALA